MRGQADWEPLDSSIGNEIVVPSPLNAISACYALHAIERHGRLDARLRLDAVSVDS